MNNKYQQGIAREVVRMHKKQTPVSEIMRKFNVTEAFVMQSITQYEREPHKFIIHRETSIDYTGISETGGY